MKKTKKLVCLLLTCLLLCSVFMLPAGAQEQQPDQAALLQVFKTYLDENKVAYQEWEELVFVEPITQSNGWTIFYGTSGISNPMGGLERIGQYVFASSSWEIPYIIALYAEKDGNIFTLKEAYEAGEIDIEAIANTTSRYINVYFAGDTNTDGAITVADVINVQNVIVRKTHIETPFTQDCFYDYNGDGTVNVEDVLAMQKYVAKVA